MHGCRAAGRDQRQITKRRSRHGFTPIELLIVVAVIRILAATAVPSFLNAQTRAKVSRAIADLRSIRMALQMYITDNGRAILDPVEMTQLGRVRTYASWEQPTTPITYISPGAFTDPVIPDGNRTAAQETVGTFQYRNTKWMRQVNNQGAANHGDPTTTWVARSPGPDRFYIPYPGELAYWMAYMPSNGLVSFGDLMVADKGILGQNFTGQDWPLPSDNTGY